MRHGMHDIEQVIAIVMRKMKGSQHRRSEARATPRAMRGHLQWQAPCMAEACRIKGL